MPRPPKLSPDEQRAVARLVADMRGAGIAWKRIMAAVEDTYGVRYGRKRLWQLSQQLRPVLVVSEVDRPGPYRIKVVSKQFSVCSDAGASVDFLPLDARMGELSRRIGVSVLSLGSGPSLPPVQPAPPTPTLDDAEVEKARREQVIANRNAKGRRAAIVTGGQGATTSAPTRRATLMGE